MLFSISFEMPEKKKSKLLKRLSSNFNYYICNHEKYNFQNSFIPTAINVYYHFVCFTSGLYFYFAF